MHGVQSFFLTIFLLLIITIALNYMVWFQYATFQKWLIKLNKYAEQLHLPLTSQTNKYITSTSYKWIARFILLFGLLMFSSIILLRIVFPP